MFMSSVDNVAEIRGFFSSVRLTLLAVFIFEIGPLSTGGAQAFSPPTLSSTSTDHFIVMIDDSGDMNEIRRLGAVGSLVTTALKYSSQALPHGYEYKEGEDYLSVVFFSLQPCPPSWQPDRLFRSNKEIGFRRFATYDEIVQAVDEFVREQQLNIFQRYGWSPIATAPLVVIPYLGERIPGWLGDNAGPKTIGRIIRILITNGKYNSSASPAGEVSHLRRVLYPNHWIEHCTGPFPSSSVTEGESDVVRRLRSSMSAFDDSAITNHCFLTKDTSQWLGCGAEVYRAENVDLRSWSELDRAYFISYSELQPRAPSTGLVDITNKNVRLRREVDQKGNLFLAGPFRPTNRIRAVGALSETQFSIRPVEILVTRQASSETQRLLPSFDLGGNWGVLPDFRDGEEEIIANDSNDFQLKGSDDTPPDKALASIEGYTYYAARFELSAPLQDGTPIYPFVLERPSKVVDVNVAVDDSEYHLHTMFVDLYTMFVDIIIAGTTSRIVTDTVAADLGRSAHRNGTRWPVSALAQTQQEEVKAVQAGLRVALLAAAIFLLLAWLFYRFVLRLQLSLEIGTSTRKPVIVLDFDWRARHEDNEEPDVQVAAFSVINNAGKLFGRNFHLLARIIDESKKTALDLRSDQNLVYITSKDEKTDEKGEVLINRRARAGDHRYFLFFRPSAIKDIKVNGSSFDLAEIETIDKEPYTSNKAYLSIPLKWSVAVLQQSTWGKQNEIGRVPVSVDLQIIFENPEPKVSLRWKDFVIHRNDEEVKACEVEIRSGAKFRCSKRIRLAFKVEIDALAKNGERIRLKNGFKFGKARSDLDPSVADFLEKVASSRGVGFQETLSSVLILDTQGRTPAIRNPKEDSDRYHLNISWERT